MLQRYSGSDENANQLAILSPAELLLETLRIVRRHKALMLVCIAAFCGVGILYLMTTPQQFRASATMIMDTRRTPGLQSQGTADVPLDNPTVESQVEILKSENVALSVIRDLKLTEDDGLLASSGLGAVFGLLSSFGAGDGTVNDDRNLRRIVQSFENRLTIRRVGVTYVFDLQFLHPNPARAAEIANAVAEAYVVEQLEAKYQSTKRAGAWLQERLKDLGKQAGDAERAVVEFKTRNRIVDTGGRLLTDQQVMELNSQQVLARSAVGEAKARLDRVESMLRSDVPEVSVQDMLRNEAVVRLRNQMADLSKRENDLIARVGPTHQAIGNIRSEMREVRRSLLEELKRVAEAYRSEFQIATSRLESVDQTLERAIVDSQSSSEAQVELRQLESAAQSYRALYDNFLQRYMEAVQQQSIPLSEARLVTRATPPLRKAEPRGGITMALMIILGSVVGFGIAWVRETSDKTIRSAKALEILLQVPCLGSLPALKQRGAAGSQTNLLWEVHRRPISRFAEVMRSIKIAIDVNADAATGTLVGIVSSIPGEGKTTVAANLADLIHASGARVILIDADLRRPSLSQQLAPDANAGLVEVLGGLPFEQALRHTPGHPPLLPSLRQGQAGNSPELLASTAMQALVKQLKAEYDYIIVDLPPLIPVVDARAMAKYIDAVLMVVGWAHVDSDTLRQAFTLSPQLEERVIGTVLNRVDEKAERAYGQYGRYDFSGYYGKG